MECAPAFNYARDQHTTNIIHDESVQHCHQDKALFNSKNLELDLRYVAESMLGNVPAPVVKFQLCDLSADGLLGPAVDCNFVLEEGQRVTFVLRICPDKNAFPNPRPTQELADRLGVPLQGG